MFYQVQKELGESKARTADPRGIPYRGTSRTAGKLERVWGANTTAWNEHVIGVISGEELHCAALVLYILSLSFFTLPLLSF